METCVTGKYFTYVPGSSYIVKLHPKKYLVDRTISLTYGGEFAKKSRIQSTHRGEGPLTFLWNLFLDTLLKQLSAYTAFPKYMQLFAWADDVFLIILFDKSETDSLKNKLCILLWEADICAQHNKASFSTDKPA